MPKRMGGLLTTQGGPAAPIFSNTRSLPPNGVDVYGTFGNNLHTQRTDTRTWAWWMKLTDTTYTGYNAIGGDQGDSGRGLILYVEAGTGLLRFQLRAGSPGSGGSVHIRTNAAITTGTWQHWVAVYFGDSDATTMKLYKNGSLAATTVSNNDLTATTVSTDNFDFARNPSGGGLSYFKGFLDEFAIFNIALNSTQVTTLYDSGTAVDVSALSFAANALVWPRMGDTTGDVVTKVKNALNPGTLDMTVSNLLAFSTDAVAA